MNESICELRLDFRGPKLVSSCPLEQEPSASSRQLEESLKGNELEASDSSVLRQLVTEVAALHSARKNDLEVIRQLQARLALLEDAVRQGPRAHAHAPA